MRRRSNTCCGSETNIRADRADVGLGLSPDQDARDRLPPRQEVKSLLSRFEHARLVMSVEMLIARARA